MVAYLILVSTYSIKTPSIAQIFGVRVGYNSQTDLERKLGKGRRRTGMHPQGIESWATKSPQALIETEGFDLAADRNYLLEYINWSEKFPQFMRPSDFHRFSRVKRSQGWLGKIVLGDSSTYIRQVTKPLIGAPTLKGEDLFWEQKGHVPIGQDDFKYWKASLSFDKHHRLTSITVVAWYDLKH